MKKRLSLFFAVVFASLLFCLSALAGSDVVEVDSQSEFDSAVSYYSALASSQAKASGSLVSSFADFPSVQAGASGSFVPSLTFEGTSLPYGSSSNFWLDEVSYGQSIVYQFACSESVGYSASFVLAQVNRKNVKFVLSGFQNNATYTGVAYFQMTVPRASTSTSSDYMLYRPSTPAGALNWHEDLLTDFLVSSVSCKDGSGQDVPVYYSRQLDSSGKIYTYTFYIVLQDYYIAPSNGVVSVDNVVLDVGFVMASQLGYQLQASRNFPFPYYALVSMSNKFLSRGFSGTVSAGRSSFLSDTINDADQRQRADQASLAADQLEQQESLASAQASRSAAQQEQLLNGYNNSASSDLENGNSAVESGVASEGDALDSAGSMAQDFDYDSVDLSELATAFSLISGWFTSLVTALGSWNMLIMISLTMVVALFAIGYFRNH